MQHEREYIYRIEKKLVKISDQVLNFLGVNENNGYTKTEEFIRGPAPCHHGDNITAFVYYHHSNQWRCWTKGCHEQYEYGIFGLLRAITKKNFVDCIQISKQLISDSADVLYYSSYLSDNENKNSNCKNQINYIDQHLYQPTFPENMLSSLNSAESYCKKRNISFSAAKSLGAGYSVRGRLIGRFILPVRNIQGKIVGFTGRIVNNSQHNVKWMHWPSKRNSKNGVGFRKNINFFNFDKSFNTSGSMNKTIIIVEGPIDVLKFISAGFDNCIGVMGSNISKGQIELLKVCGINNIVLAFDNDEPGRIASKKTKKKLIKNMFNVKEIFPEKDKDWGDMSVEYTKRCLGDIYE